MSGEAVEGVVLPEVLLTMANGLPLRAAVSDDAIIVTVIESVEGLDVREHDSLMAALLYVSQEYVIVTGDWTRVFIGNVEELHRERALRETANTTDDEPEDDGAPCCYPFVTSKGQDHEPGCAGDR